MRIYNYLDEIELIEYPKNGNNKLIKSPKIDGVNITLLKKYIVEEENEDVANVILKNAFKAMPYFVDTSCECKDSLSSKILAIGKVQSGKTSFFISTIALAFDNGYDVAYLVGGTKNPLKEQNLQRVQDYFSNNHSVKVFNIDDISSSTIIDHVSIGYKVVVVVLKNTTGYANLTKAADIVKSCDKLASVVVDDEGDEYTPGSSAKMKKTGKNLASHDTIVDMINSIRRCTYLSVTATPQANFLISTIDEVSPDYAVLVSPGPNYVGGSCFHDTKDNKHVVTILDTDDFIDSIPVSFEESLNFFIFSACLQRVRGKKDRYSMLVHPSSYTKVQGAVVEKIRDRVETLRSILSNKFDIAYKQTLSDILGQRKEYEDMNTILLDVNDDDLEKEIANVANDLKVFEFNTTKYGKNDIEEEKKDSSLYKIYVGGNMLGRGLTIKNLIVTYIYRDAKIPAVDSLYQRARWLGYKAAYFDICRVYTTDSIRTQFWVAVDCEQDMWNNLINFLKLGNDIKQFPRCFKLSDETGKMVLTRTTVSKTVRVERINPGYNYDRSVWYKNDSIKNNYNLFKNYFSLMERHGREEEFSTNHTQTHFIIDTTFTKFYSDFLKDYSFPIGSEFSLVAMNEILKQIADGKMDDDLKIVVMRYKTGQYRSLNADGKSIKELPQSYNIGTDYAGDKNLPGLVDKTHFQIHLVYTDPNNTDEIIPMLAYNNPMLETTIKYVTGDNYYGNSI